MDATTLLITVYCLIDDWLAGRRLRQRGPQPTLADSEVLTIACGGGVLGMHRGTLVRQAANLWAVKAQLHQELLGQVDFDPQISLVDSVAVPVCRFARA